jgi:uncharacterized repeat protein (TIGR04052 family)
MHSKSSSPNPQRLSVQRLSVLGCCAKLSLAALLPIFVACESKCEAGAQCASQQPTTDASAPSSDEPTHATHEAADAAPAPEGVCQRLRADCAGHTDAESVAYLCLKVGSEADTEQCAALSDECDSACHDELGGEVTGTPQQCEWLGEHCHGADDGRGLAHLCHEVGHTGSVSQCEAIYDECVALCAEGAAATPLDAALHQQDITLQFRAAFGAETFSCGQQYANQGATGATMSPRDFRFYVSDVHLLNGAGEAVPLQMAELPPYQGEGVALLDFEDGSGDCLDGDVGLNSTVSGSVPAGDYVGVLFSTSVPLNLNHADPTTLPAPLQASQMTWGWLGGYKFIKLELSSMPAATLDGSVDGGSGEPPVAAETSLHFGSIGCAASVEGDPTSSVNCAMPNRNRIQLEAFDLNSDVIVADLSAWLAESDLSLSVLCHPLGDGCAPIWERAGLDETGNALPVQNLFRVE